MSAGISDPTRPDAARELGGLQIIDNRPLAVSLLRPDEFSRLGLDQTGAVPPGAVPLGACDGTMLHWDPFQFSTSGTHALPVVVQLTPVTPPV
jgi:hypothetical protein